MRATLLGVVLLIGAVAEAHENTEAYGTLELAPEGAHLTLFVPHEDWGQLLDLDLDRDGNLTILELGVNARPIADRIQASVNARNEAGACPVEVGPPLIGVRHNKVFVRSDIAFSCVGRIRRFTLQYNLFADVHPGHRMLTQIRVDLRELSQIIVTNPVKAPEFTWEVQGLPNRESGVLDFLWR